MWHVTHVLGGFKILLRVILLEKLKKLAPRLVYFELWSHLKDPSSAIESSSNNNKEDCIMGMCPVS